FAAINDEINLAQSIALESDGPYHYAEAIEADRAMLEQARQLDSWDELQAYMVQSSFAKLSRKRVDCNDDKKEQCNQVRDSHKKRWNEMQDAWFKRDLESQIRDMQQLAQVIKQLAELLKEFQARYTTKKNEYGVVDFSALEHYCLQ